MYKDVLRMYNIKKRIDEEHTFYKKCSYNKKIRDIFRLRSSYIDI